MLVTLWPHCQRNVASFEVTCFFRWNELPEKYLRFRARRLQPKKQRPAAHARLCHNWKPWVRLRIVAGAIAFGLVPLTRARRRNRHERDEWRMHSPASQRPHQTQARIPLIAISPRSLVHSVQSRQISRCAYFAMSARKRVVVTSKTGRGMRMGRKRSVALV